MLGTVAMTAALTAVLAFLLFAPELSKAASPQSLAYLTRVWRMYPRTWTCFSRIDKHIITEHKRHLGRFKPRSRRAMREMFKKALAA